MVFPKISVMSSDRMAVAFSSGKIIIRQVKTVSSNTCSSIDKLIIPCPENLKEELDADLDEMDTDGPSLCSSRNGKQKYHLFKTKKCSTNGPETLWELKKVQK